MSFADYPYQTAFTAAQARPDERATFIRRTYGHLAGAIAVFALVEYLLFQLVTPAQVMNVISLVPYSWLIILALFMGVSTMANKMAMSQTSQKTQYLGLGLYVVAEALIFLPILMMAQAFAGGELIAQAAVLTIFMFLGITTVAFTTRKDFSFLGGILKVSGWIALGMIAVSILFGMSLGMWFSAAMILFASASILYSTSNLMHQYCTDQHVSASLSLFASVALSRPPEELDR